MEAAALGAKPSFTSSVASGMTGWVKGLLAGGTVGVIAGAAIGAIIGLFAGGIGAGAGAMMGAQIGGTAFGAVGSMAGAMTGVVKSREAATPTANDVVSLAKISYAKGAEDMHKAHEAAASKWRDKHAQEQLQGPQQPARG